uniref:EF-hand domain-containing protein n=2 Tax=Globodera rostochiensis TaxID=31243 RepID=A0A914HR82_GLORO
MLAALCYTVSFISAMPKQFSETPETIDLHEVLNLAREIVTQCANSEAVEAHDLELLATYCVLVKIDEVASCKLVIWDDDGCCTYTFWKPSKCPGAFKPNCNVFNHNCVGCQYSYGKKEGCCEHIKCSCYYCCDPKYAESCPYGCQNCTWDGKTSCNATFKSIGNSSSSILESVKNARKDFDMVDVDKNGSISLNEAIAYLRSKANGTLPKHLAKNMSWFADIDLNGNNQIEPGEFDRSLIGVDDQTSG